MDVLSGAVCMADCNTTKTECLTTCPGAYWVQPGVASVTDGAFASVRVTDIVLGNAIGADKRITTPTTKLKSTDTTIYASVATEGAAPSVTLTARWTYQDGQIVSEFPLTIAPTTGAAVTEFHIAKPDGWPLGKYTFEIKIDGQNAGAQEFEVAR